MKSWVLELRNMGSPSLQEFVTLYLNEVLSIRAQEWIETEEATKNAFNLNEVLSIRAQEWGHRSLGGSSRDYLNEVLSIRAQEWGYVADSKWSVRTSMKSWVLELRN